MHIGAENFLVFVLQLIIALFLLHTAAVYWSDTAFGKALSYIIGA